MTMLKTLRTIERQSRQILCVCGLAALLGIPAKTPIQAEEDAESRVVRYQSAAARGPVGAGSGLLPRSGSLGSGSLGAGKSDPIYAEGDIIYEGPEGMYPSDGPSMFGDGYDFSCPPTWIGSAEMLFMNRESNSLSSLTSGLRLDEFGYDEAGRVTLSHRYDCLIGWEASYTGPFEWNQSSLAGGAGLTTILGASGVNITAFNNAVFHQEIYTSRFQSAEFSQKWWGWDVITTSAGLKYINVDEDFRFDSVNALAETGLFMIDTNNRMVGGQIGLDLTLPIGPFATTTKLRGSAYANFMESRTLLTNAGVVQVNNIDEEVDFAAMLELGYFFSYHVTPGISVRCGYELAWLYGLALATHQTSTTLSPSSGIQTDRDGDVFYHNLSGGVEVAW